MTWIVYTNLSIIVLTLLASSIVGLVQDRRERLRSALHCQFLYGAALSKSESRRIERLRRRGRVSQGRVLERRAA